MRAPCRASPGRAHEGRALQPKRLGRGAHSMKAPQTKPFEFGLWRVDPARGLISRPEGREQRLEPKLVDLLVLFAGSGGRVLSKDEIVEAVWEGRAIGDDTLAAAISRLRRALDDTADQRLIETVPKRGYRSTIATELPTGRLPAAPEAGPAQALA